MKQVGSSKFFDNELFIASHPEGNNNYFCCNSGVWSTEFCIAGACGPH